MPKCCWKFIWLSNLRSVWSLFLSFGNKLSFRCLIKIRKNILGKFLFMFLLEILCLFSILCTFIRRNWCYQLLPFLKCIKGKLGLEIKSICWKWVWRMKFWSWKLWIIDLSRLCVWRSLWMVAPLLVWRNWSLIFKYRIIACLLRLILIDNLMRVLSFFFNRKKLEGV